MKYDFLLINGNKFIKNSQYSANKTIHFGTLQINYTYLKFYRVDINLY